MKNNEKMKPIKNRELPGYGYDKSLDDLKVIGKNREASKNTEQEKSDN